MLVDSPVPGVAGYGQTLDTAKYAYQQALSKIGLNRQNLLRNYGYQADFNPDGTWGNLRVDGGNQYGQLQQMLGSQANQDAAVIDNNVGRGIHGGLANQGITTDHRMFGAQDAQFGSQVVNDLTNTTADWKTANDTYNNALYEAQLQAARNAVTNGDFNQADYNGIDVPTYGNDNPYYPGNANGQSASTPSDYAGNGGTGNLPVARAKSAAALMAKLNPGGAKALAATSAALNAKYGLSKPAAASVVKNAYTNTKSKKRG